VWSGIEPRRPTTVFDRDRNPAGAPAAERRLVSVLFAYLVEGDDELGAFASVHERLAKAHVDIYASSGVTDGQGSFGYVTTCVRISSRKSRGPLSSESARHVFG
jgi:hypothetical protein